MDEDSPSEVVDNYDFPDQYFEELRSNYEDDMGDYSIVTGGLFRALEDPAEPHFSDKDAMQVVRMLQRGEIDEAEDFVYSSLD